LEYARSVVQVKKSSKVPPSSPSGAATAGGELALISRIRSKSQTANPSVVLGIGDDCALLRPAPGEELAITTDFSLENVHFRRDWHSPESVGHRCLARGLSDLAAMGARPIAAFLSLALPAELTTSQAGQPVWIDRFLDQLLTLAERMGVQLAGGDTAQSPRLKGSDGLVAADIVLIGGAKRGRALLRSGAKAGDIIYVTGALGGSAAELLALERNPKSDAETHPTATEHPHLFPEPRIEAGLVLAAKRLATGAIDVSDGLSTDLRHLCEESGLAAEIEASAIPIHAMAQQAEESGWGPSALDLALHGGEDYELLFTAPPSKKIPTHIGGLPIQAIGRMRASDAGEPVITILALDGSRQELEAKGWEHFR
jgi:thiamine-monophosphate kinase